MAQGGQETEP